MKIHKAVVEFDYDALRLLLGDGADVNERNEYGRTALHLAVIDNSADMIGMLLAAGADLNAKSAGYMRYVDRLDISGDGVSIEERGNTLFHVVAAHGIEDMRGGAWQAELRGALAYLVSQGANVNVQNEAGKTPLHIAYDVVTADLLISLGADLDAQSHDGLTALHIAAGMGDGGLAELLLRRGASPNIRGPQGMTPLHWVRGSEIVEALLLAGADVNAKDDAGLTPLDSVFRWLPLDFAVANALRAHGGRKS